MTKYRGFQFVPSNIGNRGFGERGYQNEEGGCISDESNSLTIGIWLAHFALKVNSEAVFLFAGPIGDFLICSYLYVVLFE